MSDILIKGMEMPKNLGVSVTIYPDGRVIRYLGYGAKEQLGVAVPVPSHGRLIDADALVRDNGIKEIPEYHEVVLAAPTIIPASEEHTMEEFMYGQEGNPNDGSM